MTARDRTVLIVVLALVALGAGWLLVVSPKRSAAAKLDNSIQAVQQQLATLQGQVAADQSARAAFSTDYVELAQLGEAVPKDDNVPSLLVELQGAARASGIDFRGLQVTGGGSPGPSAAATAGAPAAAGAAGATGTAATPPPPGVSGSGGFGAEQFTFSFSGQFFALSDFLGRVEDFVVTNGALVRVSGRLMTLNAISLGPSAQGFPEMTASVSATTYLLPASQGLLDGATSAGPATAPTGSSPASAATAPAGSTSPGSTASGTGAAPASTTGTGAAPASTTGTGAAPSSTNGGPSASPGKSGAPGATSSPSGAAGASSSTSGTVNPSAAISAPPATSGGLR